MRNRGSHGRAMISDPDRFVKVFDVLDSGFKDWKSRLSA
jgi:hypothetical protein